MTEDADLLIAGGGPAGLATALYALRAGLHPLIVEPRAEGTDKACGEGLMPSAVRALAELGVSVSGQPISGIRYVQGRHRVEAAFRTGAGLGVRRTTLHTALHRAVVAAGVPIQRARVTRVQSGTTGVLVPDLGLRGRWLVAADGLHSPVTRGLGLTVDDSRSAPRYGLRRHFAVAPASSAVEVHYGPHGEAYLTPVGPELTGVALLTTHRAPFATQLAAFPELAARFPAELAMTAVRGAGPLRRRVRRRVDDRILLVGDAAGYVDAITGEGVALALSGAAALTDCLRRGRPQDYESAWRRATRRHRLLTELLVAARTNRLSAERIVPAAQRFPSVFAAVVNALA